MTNLETSYDDGQEPTLGDGELDQMLAETGEDLLKYLEAASSHPDGQMPFVDAPDPGQAESGNHPQRNM